MENKLIAIADFHAEGNIWAATGGAFMGIIMQIQQPSGGDFLIRAAIGGIVGGAAGWGIKNLLDWAKKKIVKEPEIKYKKHGRNNH